MISQHTNAFDGVRIFSTSHPADRTRLGDSVTAWLESANEVLVDYAVRQSSDETHHCFTIVVFYRHP